MKIARDDIELCDDCMMIAIYGGRDLGFGPDLVPTFDTETSRGITVFTWRPCDGCGCCGGSRHAFATLVP